MLVESEVKEPNLKAMCILGSSVERLLKEDYDIVEQSNAIDAMRVELDELWDSYKKERDKLSPSGPVVKNLPANTGDMGLIPDPGGSHMPWTNKAHAP